MRARLAALGRGVRPRSAVADVVDRHAYAVRAPRRERDRDRPAVAARRSRAAPSAGAAPAIDRVGQGLARRRVGEVRLDRGRQAVEPQLDPVVELEAGVLAQVLDRALELAGVALGDAARA